MEKLTKLIALKTVEEINKNKLDDEQAHSDEDSLYAWFIDCIAANMYTKKEAQEIAEIVRMTSEISFARWCA